MIGWIMLSIPFIAFFLYVAKKEGIKFALMLYLITALPVSFFVCWLLAAAHFIRG